MISLGTVVNESLCPFCKLKTLQAIWMKPPTVVDHNETMRHMQEPYLCFALF